jgi:hypothetical protein
MYRQLRVAALVIFEPRPSRVIRIRKCDASLEPSHPLLKARILPAVTSRVNL